MWKNTRVLVTGGASFIGSHLVDALLELGADVHVIDDLSSGSLTNLPSYGQAGGLGTGSFSLGDLGRPEVIQKAIQFPNKLGSTPAEIIFHLAADHGGRGYIDTHQVAGATNLLIDQQVFRAALGTGSKVVYASSGCIYPLGKQGHPEGEQLYLRERDAGPPYEADNLYGWAKLMGEKTLQAYYEEHQLPSVSCRLFTVYGPRGKEDHAIMAMIAKAYIQQDPFEIWGDGTQIRNWTYVDDIVRGMILAAETVDHAIPINLGTSEVISVTRAARKVCTILAHDPDFFFALDKPTGPLNRVADNTLAHRLLGWEPQISFEEGLHRTIEWYVKTKTVDEVKTLLADGALMSR